jgi:hypothetical protein
MRIVSECDGNTADFECFEVNVVLMTGGLKRG